MKENITICLRSFTAFCLLISVFVFSSAIVSAASEKKAAMGELVVSGHNVGGDDPYVMLNGERAFSGRTFFSSGNIATSENSNAIIRLGNLGSISLAPNSNLSLTFDNNSISGKLLAGQVNVFNNEGVKVNIQTADGIVNNDAQRSSNFTVDVKSGKTQAIAQAGSVFLNNGESVLPVNAKQDDDDDDDDDDDVWIPIAVFGGIVAAAVVLTIVMNDDDDRIVSPVR